MDPPILINHSHLNDLDAANYTTNHTYIPVRGSYEVEGGYCKRNYDGDVDNVLIIGEQLPRALHLFFSSIEKKDIKKVMKSI